MVRIPKNILVVDDNPTYVRTIKYNLKASGFKVRIAKNGKSAIQMIMQEEPDLILLDILLPDTDGLLVCKKIREFSRVPIIMLTALAEDEYKVKGLNSGADDYMTKPFSTNELIARVRAVLRRVSPSETKLTLNSVFQSRNLMINFEKQRVFINKNEILLTPIEYRLLVTLAKHAGRVLVFDFILREVWGEDFVGKNQHVWKAVHRLRQKIESDPKNPSYILSLPGIGYIFQK